MNVQHILWLQSHALQYHTLHSEHQSAIRKNKHLSYRVCFTRRQYHIHAGVEIAGQLSLSQSHVCNVKIWKSGVCAHARVHACMCAQYTLAHKKNPEVQKIVKEQLRTGHQLIWENTDDTISYFLYTINILHTNTTGYKVGMTWQWQLLTVFSVCSMLVIPAVTPHARMVLLSYKRLKKRHNTAKFS